MIRLGITGTDTGVGKTLVACALAGGLRRRGLRVAGMKPMETGVGPHDGDRDGARLARAAGGALPLSVVAPLTLPDPVSPLSAARRAHATIDLAVLDHAMRTATADADALIVEGAGGLLVPITDQLGFDGLFRRWSLDIIIVAANRLGVINHTRLTVAAARAAGLHVRAIVMNSVTRETDTSVSDNAQLIAELEMLPIVTLPWIGDQSDLEHASDLLLPHVISELEHARRPFATR